MIIKIKKKDIRGDFVIVIYGKEFEEYERKVEKRIKEISLGFEKSDKTNNIIKFDKKNSILFIKNYKIQIKKRSEETISHFILKYLFDPKNNYIGCYSFMAEEKDILLKRTLGTKYWKTFYRACDDIQNKIIKATNYKITDFLIFNTGVKGEVKINKKYLK